MMLRNFIATIVAFVLFAFAIIGPSGAFASVRPITHRPVMNPEESLIGPNVPPDPCDWIKSTPVSKEFSALRFGSDTLATDDCIDPPSPPPPPPGPSCPPMPASWCGGDNNDDLG